MADRLCTSVRPYKKGQSPIFGYFLPGTSNIRDNVYRLSSNVAFTSPVFACFLLGTSKRPPGEPSVRCNLISSRCEPEGTRVAVKYPPGTVSYSVLTDDYRTPLERDTGMPGGETARQKGTG